MKKIFIGALLALAIASFGGTTLLAHAQTAPAGDQATLQQQLELMKAKLQLLQLQQAGGATQTQVAQPAPAAAAVNISPENTAALNSALSALATTLVSLQSAIQSNPQFLSQNGSMISNSLAGIEGSLADVLVSMQSGPSAGSQTAFDAYTQQVAQRGSAAAAAPAAGAGANQAPLAAANQNSLLPSVDSLTQPANAQPQDNQSAAVAASSLAGKNRLPAIIVGIILLAMIAILVWGRGGEELETAPVAARSSGPVPSSKSAPVMPVPPSISFVSNQSTSASPSSMPSQSPLASAMGTQKK